MLLFCVFVVLFPVVLLFLLLVFQTGYGTPETCSNQCWCLKPGPSGYWHQEVDLQLCPLSCRLRCFLVSPSSSSDFQFVVLSISY